MGHPNRPTRASRRSDIARRARTTVLLCVALLPTACGSNAPADQSVTTPSVTTSAPLPSRTVTAAPMATGTSRTSTTPTVDPYAGMPLIDHVAWTETVDGSRLRVYPTTAGRQTTFPGTDERAWQEVLTESPDADTPGMRDQFICHWIWARLVEPNKTSWNLEPWRPAVGYQATVDARCNPGGPER
ncbi:DUF2599 domain-containing protein [Nocardia suismassiliense]|uniref:DUF2599 domain-containing protein n=1 Tax=Nocardia suismassiliense TaxID=2077092 RepID=A0ABW6R4Q8_9NOCA